MSLLAELEARGVTAEDLEKAAAVRLFEKAAAAEGVDLNDLDESRVEELFNHFVSNSTSTEKEASAMNDEIVELFEKTASAEGIDLDDMSDEDLAALYTHYVENVLPEQIAAAQEGEKAASAQEGEKAASANAEIVEMFQKTASAEGIDLSDFDEDELEGLFAHYVENVLPLQLEDADATDKVADAQEKLAEAEILGRHMARAYADEMDKLAEASSRIRSAASRAKDLLTAKNVRSNVSEVAGQDAGKMDKLRAYGKILSGKAGNDVMTSEARKSLAAQAGTTAGAAGLAYGGKKMYDKRKSQEKRSGFSELEVDALLKIAEEGGAQAAADAKEGLMDKAKNVGRAVDAKAQSLGKYLAGIGSGGAGRGGVKTHRALGYGVPAAATSALAYGGKKMYDRSKRGQEKRSSAIDYEDVVSATALQLLADAGYDV
jgi:hypothetical protein